MILLNMVYALRKNSNFISLGQLREARILYYNHPKSIILKNTGNLIGLAQQKKNFFVLDIKDNLDKIMTT